MFDVNKLKRESGAFVIAKDSIIMKLQLAVLAGGTPRARNPVTGEAPEAGEGGLYLMSGVINLYVL